MQPCLRLATGNPGLVAHKSSGESRTHREQRSHQPTEGGATRARCRALHNAKWRRSAGTMKPRLRWPRPTGPPLARTVPTDKNTASSVQISRRAVEDATRAGSREAARPESSAQFAATTSLLPNIVGTRQSVAVGPAWGHQALR